MLPTLFPSWASLVHLVDYCRDFGIDLRGVGGKVNTKCYPLHCLISQLGHVLPIAVEILVLTFLSILFLVGGI